VDGAAEQDLDDERGLREHHRGRQEDGGEELRRRAREETGDAAERAAPEHERVEEAERAGKEEQRGGAEREREQPSSRSCDAQAPGQHPEREERQPERRDEVGERAEQEMNATERREPLGGDESKMLEVALAPPPITRQVIRERRGWLFEALTEI